ncbi:RIO2 family protein [Clostridium guangxiense]|uniref:serine/threonine protein kinase n=1 Tax=Clostridium guangxiense TaxID=1662055 RepID=UPI001E299B6C|nr:serine/threonine protein kinase [Clostridium guangxiense]MCD2345434.1 serine/threonine protein kinase [Clostridium guangxiense]
MKEKKCHTNAIIRLDECTFLGKGHSGSVYLMNDGRVVKIFKNPETCKEEYYVLKKLINGPYYPKPFEFHNHYMIREYIGGTNISEYINKHGVSKKLIIEIINFLCYIKENGFKKIDVRFPHIFVQENTSIKVIDPRNSYTQKTYYPKHLIRDLTTVNSLDLFWNVLKEKRPDLFKKWYRRVKK